MSSLSEEETVSSIEKDLLLSYIRQFYDAVLNESIEPAKTAPPVQKVKKVKAPVAKKVAKEVPYTPPKVVEIPASIKELEQEVKATPPEPGKPKVQQPIVTPAKAPTKLTAKFKKIFEFKEAKELSERLSQSPIKDLTKSLAINDRLLYVSELFNHQQTAFTETLNQLNGLSSYEEAVTILVSFAEENEWTDGEKIDTAKAFAKLVKRRYK